MEENVKTGELMEAMQELLRQLEHEDEELLARHDELKKRMLVLKTTGEMLEENERLQIKKKWKLFQQLWGISNLAQLAGSWQQTGKLPPDARRIDDLLK